MLLSQVLLVSSKDSPGACPSFTRVKNFNADAYLGRWFEFRRDAGTIFELMADCVTATYALKANGNISVKNRAWYWFFFFSYYEIEGEAACFPSGGEGGCQVNFAPGEKDMTKEKNYQVLSTDYTNYSIVYSCTNIGANKREDFWILTRAAIPTEEEAKTYKALAKTLVPSYDHEYVVYTK